MKKTVYLVIISIITCVCMIFGLCRNIMGLYSYRIGVGTSTVTSEAQKIDGFTDMNLDMDVVELKIIEGDEFSVSFDGSEALQPIVSVKNGVLSVRQGKKNKIFNNVNLKSKMTITIPAGTMLDAVVLSVDAGKIDMQGFSIRDLSMDVDAGSIKITDCKIEYGELDVDAGDIDVKNSTMGKSEICADAGNIGTDDIEFEQLDVSTDMGNISMNLPLSYEEYSYELEVDLGNITIDGESHRGSFSKDGTKGNYKLNASCSMGNVDISSK